MRYLVRLRNEKSWAGCCTTCKGTGYSGEECTGGMCSDCYATGHTHSGRCARELPAVIRRGTARRLSLRQPELDWWHREPRHIVNPPVWNTCVRCGQHVGIGTECPAAPPCGCRECKEALRGMRDAAERLGAHLTAAQRGANVVTRTRLIPPGWDLSRDT